MYITGRIWSFLEVSILKYRKEKNPLQVFSVLSIMGLVHTMDKSYYSSNTTLRHKAYIAAGSQPDTNPIVL